MHMRWLVISLFIASSTCAATLDSMVAANYPRELADFATRHHLKDDRQQTYAAITAGGAEFIVAAYSNGDIGAVSLLERTAMGLNVVSVMLKPVGTHPTIELQDLDGDKQPEVIAQFETARGSGETWIYRIAGRGLHCISPVDGRGHTLLGLPDVVDFGRGNTLDLVDADVEGRGDDTAVSYVDYALVDGTYVQAAVPDFYEIFYRGKAQPKTASKRFNIAQSDVGKPFRLIVANGGQSGRDYRVAAGTITLNGTVISPASDFSESRGSWSVPISLQAENTIVVRLEGKPNSRIAVAIVH